MGWRLPLGPLLDSHFRAVIKADLEQVKRFSRDCGSVLYRAETRRFFQESAQ